MKNMHKTATGEKMGHGQWGMLGNVQLSYLYAYKTGLLQEAWE